MFSLISYCQQKLENCQQKLENWIPEIPKDTVYMLVRNTLFSGGISLILTQGDRVSGTKSAALAALVVLIYSIAVAICSKLGGYNRANPLPGWVHWQIFAVAVGIGLVLGKRFRLQTEGSIGWSTASNALARPRSLPFLIMTFEN